MTPPPVDKTIPTMAFQDLLKKAKALAEKKSKEDQIAAITSMEDTILNSPNPPTAVDLSQAGITPYLLVTKEGREQAAEIVAEICSSSSSSSSPATSIPTSQKRHTTGVAADVTLNSQQELFISEALAGKDLCLIGAAGTGKTTGTGKFINKLIDSGQLEPLGSETKYLLPTVPGVLITSFTRKAVNNIRRAVPEPLRPHVLTIHKVLEFQPVFYEVFDEKTSSTKKTMKFEPNRTAINPLPSTLKLVVYEESSMIGTELYNLLSAAMPHNPQEIFIGDIRQLPPIFGPAILGFKMSLLPVVELTEVYRQALLSPIIRLAHAVLSGDGKKFSTEVELRKEKHPILGTTVERKFIPSLEAFNENGPHGSVKIQVWQKKLPSETALNTTVLQFVAWIKNGYYNPHEDVILCPFNKAFGTVELNKGIQNYLGRERGAVVHEVIAGFEKHYLAIGDRILFDKEDAVIVDIRRNLSYLGKTPQPSSIHLDRWGAYQEQLSEEETCRVLEEESKFDEEVMNKFMESFGEDEQRVNQASHAIDILFKYTDEKITLSSASEVNSILGGNAITVHKMQGSEAEKIFLVLHHSHSVGNIYSNELLYTAITRARKHLHIICEIDSFNKMVRKNIVRGVTLADKIDFFKGKVEFKEMQAEIELLKKQKERKEKELAEGKRSWKVVDKIDSLIYDLQSNLPQSQSEVPEVPKSQKLQTEQSQEESEDDRYIVDWTNVVPEFSSVEHFELVEYEREDTDPKQCSSSQEAGVTGMEKSLDTVTATKVVSTPVPVPSLPPVKPLTLTEKLAALRKQRH